MAEPRNLREDSRRSGLARATAVAVSIAFGFLIFSAVRTVAHGDNVGPLSTMTTEESGQTDGDKIASSAKGQRTASEASSEARATDGERDDDTIVKAPPERIEIPAIGVAAPVIELGLNPAGALEVPKVYSETGWYKGGPEPGEVGRSVIAGHVDDYTGPAVFFRLRELGAGDEIIVHHIDGDETVFTVERTEKYRKDAFPTDEVYGSSGDVALRLVTCGGDFNETAKSYESNVIVFATRTA